MRNSRFISLAAALVLTCAAVTGGAPARAATGQDTPHRVVSLNLCTDQMALLLAEPGQLAALSKLARDPRSSAMADEALAVPVTDGSAEAVMLLKPDLVLAGTWTTRATVEMLERLGVRVETFAPAMSLDEARANLLRMGEMLGQRDRAVALVAAFDDRLAELTGSANTRPRAVYYMPHGATAGDGTLTGDIMRAAGLDNLAADLPPSGRLPLEELVLADPDLVLIARAWPGHARATEDLRHPALRASGALREIPDGANWTCETPHLLDAVSTLRDMRLEWEAGE